MPKEKRSFFERLTGSVPTDTYYDEDEEIEDTRPPQAHLAVSSAKTRTRQPLTKKEEWALPDEEGQLTVDVFQTDDEIIIQSTVAGVRPDDLDVQITRESVTLRGKREKMREVSDDNYYYQELYWGTFSRSITLPTEVDVDGAEATLKNGLITIRLPKLDKNRTERIKVRNE